MADEDFTAYSESGVDAGTYTTITAPKVQVDDSVREANWILSDDKGASHFGATFEHDWSFFGGPSAQLKDCGCWGVTNDLTGGLYDWETNDREAIVAVWRGSGADMQLWGCEDNDEDQTAGASDVPAGTQFYCTTERTGETACQLEIYNDSGRENIVDTLVVAVTSGRRFQHAVAAVAMTHPTATSRATDWRVENLDLKEAAGGLSIPVAMHHYTKNIGSR